MFHRPADSQVNRTSNFAQEDALPPAHAAIHREVEKAYSDFINIMNLTHDEGAALIDTLAQYQLQITQVCAKDGPEANSLAGRAWAADWKFQLDSQIKSLLGPGRFECFENYRVVASASRKSSQ
jgi:hypothetical protein